MCESRLLCAAESGWGFLLAPRRGVHEDSGTGNTHAILLQMYGCKCNRVQAALERYCLLKCSHLFEGG
jgi:hypothetical protein